MMYLDRREKWRSAFEAARCTMQHFNCWLHVGTRSVLFRQISGQRKAKRLPPDVIHIGTYQAPVPSSFFLDDLAAAFAVISERQVSRDDPTVGAPCLSVRAMAHQGVNK